MAYMDPTGLDASEFYNSLGKPGSDSSSSAYEQAVAHSLGSAYYQTGTPSESDTGSFTSFAEHQMGLLVDVTTAYFSNAGSAAGLGYSLWHPVKTAKTLWNEVVQTVAHPVLTAQGIWGGWKNGVSDFMQADAAGRAGIIGETAGHNGFDVTLAVLAAEAPSVVHNIRAGNAAKEAIPFIKGSGIWKGDILSTTAAGDLKMYRVWGGESGQIGSWLTPVKPTSVLGARSSLALPPQNVAQFFSEVTVSAGTRFQIGIAGSGFGQAGGGIQVQLLENIPKINFGPGVPLR
jgi:hypothetical protein